MFGQPPWRLIRKHRAEVIHLPRRQTPDGEIAPQEYQAVCPCGWRSAPTTSQVALGGQQVDHVWQEWQEQKGER